MFHTIVVIFKYVGTFKCPRSFKDTHYRISLLVTYLTVYLNFYSYFHSHVCYIMKIVKNKDHTNYSVRQQFDLLL